MTMAGTAYQFSFPNMNAVNTDLVYLMTRWHVHHSSPLPMPTHGHIFRVHFNFLKKIATVQSICSLILCQIMSKCQLLTLYCFNYSNQTMLLPCLLHQCCQLTGSFIQNKQQLLRWHTQVYSYAHNWKQWSQPDVLEVKLFRHRQKEEDSSLSH